MYVSHAVRRLPEDSLEGESIAAPDELRRPIHTAFESADRLSTEGT